jgi:MFS family permease
VSSTSAIAEIRKDLGVSARALVSSFRNPNLARAQLAFVAFSICEWASFIALMVFAFDEGGSAAVGGISLVQLIPAAVIAPLGSVLGDRFRRERVFLLAEASMCVACASAAAAALLDAPALVVYAAACSVGWILTLVRPTHGALLPWLARDPTELTTAYTAAGLIESMSALLGPLLATIFFALGGSFGVSGPGLVYAALAVLLGVGSVLIVRIRTPGPPAEPEHERSAVFRELGVGFRYVWSDPRPRVLVGTLGLWTFVLGFIDVLIVVLALDVLGIGETGVGALSAALGIGGVIGAAIAVVAGSRERLFPAFRAGSFLYGVPVSAIGAFPPLAPVLLGVAGSGAVLYDVSGRTMLQRLIPDQKLTRSLGVLESVYMGSEGLGAFAGAALVASLGTAWTFVIAGAIVPVVCLALRRGLRAVDVGARVPAEDLALLRTTSLFEPLPPSALERLARNSVPVVVSPGTVVIREGDVGDRVYVIADGHADVTTSGNHVATLGPGDHVGEIALLRDVPRTATVTASSQVRLLSLERDVFLRTMTGHEPARAAAHSAAEDRLHELSTPGQEDTRSDPED